MKKFFLFILAIGLFTNCSNDPNDTPKEESGSDLIQLSAGAPGISIVNRSTGSVGSLASDTENNKWNNNTIYVYSFLKNETNFTNTPLIDNKQAVVSENGSVTWTNGTDEYFPQSGAYNLYGYHVDDAVSTPVRPTVTVNEAYLNVTINGAQDIMIAKAELTETQKSLMLTLAGINPSADEPVKEAEWSKAFGSYTARRSIHPNMSFQHLLSRLQFNIYPGSTTAQDVYIRSIQVQSRTTGRLVVVANDGGQYNRGLTSNAQPVASLYLQERTPNGLMQALSQRTYNPEIYIPGLTQQMEKQVGESLMLMPQTSYEATIEMEQQIDGEWKISPYTATLTIDGGFQAGYSYLIKITVLSLEKVELTATLVGWQDGGEVILNPEEQF